MTPSLIYTPSGIHSAWKQYGTSGEDKGDLSQEESIKLAVKESCGKIASCYPNLENMSLRCRLCWANIDDLSVLERQRHYGAHVLEESEENPQANSSSWTTSKNLSL
ncbi:MAG: hypothetical protein NXY57DRAFT_1044275 [Lentinula lateritia]|nr:MAG: hypothetical protein NXY57DRAFT_1044275 [Lentinula lateritia]